MNKGEYCDLQINYKDISVQVHKNIVCEKCPLIKKLVHTNKWPPIHTIDLDFPDISQDLFMNTINYIYDRIPNQDIINVLICLECTEEYILKLARKFHDNLDVMKKICNLYPKSQFVNFFGYNTLENNKLIYGSEDHESLINKYNTRRRFPEYKVSKDHKWFHFDSFNSGQRHIVEAFGINWSIDRFLFDFGYHDKVDFIKIYVDESYESPPGGNQINIRANFIIYSLRSNPQIHIMLEDELVPDHYKSTYMRYNRIPNKLGFNMHKYDEKNIRVSLLLELL